MKETASRMQRQYQHRSFTIRTEESSSTEVVMCNGIRIDYYNILTRKECCQDDITVFQAGFQDS